MGKIYDASVIAKWIINKIHPEPLKLQKLLYLAQGYSFAFYDRPLFFNKIEGWVHGPVVPDVYKLYSDYKYNPITISYEKIEVDKEAEDVLEYVINKYSKYDAKYLEKITHNQEPWIFSREGLDPDERSDKTINQQDIANYFINDVFQPDDEEWD
jgi:uncharacterized phage-associated protein